MLALWPAAATEVQVSTRCTTIWPTDALLLMDIQNCFMEKRSVQSVQPEYELTQASDIDPDDLDAQVDNGTIAAGALRVLGSTDIISVANAWIDLMGDDNLIYATLDYHPTKHCSFCNAHSGGIQPGSYCISGAGSTGNLNASHRCHDRVSEDDYLRASYYQWPAHCVAGTFGARLDPYLRVPNHTTVVKLGTSSTRDSYSAFDGGRISVAPPGTHDAQPDAEWLTTGDTFGTHLSEAGVQRLFVMGLAIDYVVGRTIEDALAASELPARTGDEVGSGFEGEEELPGLGNMTIALVLAASRGIFPGSTQARVDATRAHRNGQVLEATDPTVALVEACSGTCDPDGAHVAQCNSQAATDEQRDTSWCRPLPTRAWGTCVLCPEDGCRPAGQRRGRCVQPDDPYQPDAAGTCDCDFGYYGVGCAHGMPTHMMIALIAACCLFALLLLLAAPIARLVLVYIIRPRGAVRLRTSHRIPELALAEGHAYHLFLSHIWSTGQDQVAIIKRRLLELLPPTSRKAGSGPKVFLDVDDLDDIARLEEHVEASALLLCFLSRGYFLSRNVMREVHKAIHSEKPLVLVHESDPNRGGAPLGQLQAECGDATMRDAIFGGGTTMAISAESAEADVQVVPWTRVGPLQLESFRMIIHAMLLASPRYAKARKVDLLLPGSLAERLWVLPRAERLLVSQYNPGALELGKKLLEGGALYHPPKESDAAGTPSAQSTGRSQGRSCRLSLVETEPLWMRSEQIGALKSVSNPRPLRRPGKGGLVPTLNRQRSSRTVPHKSFKRSLRLSRQQSDASDCGSKRSEEDPQSPRLQRQTSTEPDTPEGSQRVPSVGSSTDSKSASFKTASLRKTAGKASSPELPKQLPKLPETPRQQPTDEESAPSVEPALEPSVEPTRMLLLLDRNTFVGDEGEALAAQVRAAMARGLPIVTVHTPELPELPDGCLFERLFSTTPADLVAAGLYKAIAVPWFGGPHQLTSCAMVLQALGAEHVHGKHRVVSLLADSQGPVAEISRPPKKNVRNSVQRLWLPSSKRRQSSLDPMKMEPRGGQLTWPVGAAAPAPAAPGAAPAAAALVTDRI